MDSITLRELRFKSRKTQYDVCKLSGIPQSRISLIERGYATPKRKERLAIAQVFNVDAKSINWPKTP